MRTACSVILSGLMVMLVNAVEESSLRAVSFADLKSAFNSESTLSELRQALSTDGILAITNIPQLQSVRRAALSTAGDCLSHLTSAQREKTSTTVDPNPIFAKRVLPDGTMRSSIGTQVLGSTGGGRERLPLQLVKECPELEAPVESLRDLVDRVAAVLAPALDDAFLPLQGGQVLLRSGEQKKTAFFHDAAYETATSAATAGRTWTSFSDVMRGGDQLEHFHSYATKTAADSDSERGGNNVATLDFHTDAGLFILFAPALYSNNIFERPVSGKGADFWYQDGAGRQHSIVVEQQQQTASFVAAANPLQHVVAPDTLILMMGQGAEDHLNPVLRNIVINNKDKDKPAVQLLRAVPHALMMAPTATAAAAAAESTRRNW